MAFMRWDDSFSTNVAEIDEQHKKLFEMINVFYETQSADNHLALGHLMGSLIDYTKFHFSTEEKYFDRFHYGAAEEHKKIHQQFIDKVGDAKRRYDDGGFVISLEITNYLKDWLVAHIKGTDRLYSVFFNQNGLI